MIDTREFLQNTQLSDRDLRAWIEAGWIAPPRDAQAHRFADIDVARAHLIHDLRRRMGVNDESVTIILGLIDQIHGLRELLRVLVVALGAQPQSTRRKIAADVRQTRKARGEAAPARRGGRHRGVHL